MAFPRTSYPKLVECANRLAEALKSDVFIFRSELIDNRSADDLVNAVKKVRRRRESVILVISTNGGVPDSAFRIARCLQAQYEYFFLYVFGYCKSAGTLLAIGADEIVMSDFGELGPLDIQVMKDDEFKRGSGLDIQRSLNVIGVRAYELFQAYFTDLITSSNSIITTKTAADIANSMAVGILSPISGQIDPLRLGEMSRLNSIALAYGDRLNHSRINAIKSLINDYPSHSFVIDREEAKKLFGESDVREPREDIEIEFESMVLPLVRYPSGQNFIDILSDPLASDESLGREEYEDKPGRGDANEEKEA